MLSRNQLVISWGGRLLCSIPMRKYYSLRALILSLWWIYIVYMGSKSHDEHPNNVTALHHRVLASVLRRENTMDSMIYTYHHGFSGFAARLTESQAKELEGYSNVKSVKRSETFQMQMTQSRDFLGLMNTAEPLPKLLNDTNYGDDVIIGIVDSGISPQFESFAGVNFGAKPSRWKGKCVVDKYFKKEYCNNKIIGARWYAAGGNEAIKRGEDVPSAIDMNGHGSHCASIAAGNFVRLKEGIIHGIAPNARLAIYKVLWGKKGSGQTVDLIKAIDDAINDGVDILSLSLAGTNAFQEVTMHAAAKGLSLVFAAGNFGPLPETLRNGWPWVTTVASTTIDRSLETVITLGNGQKLVGQSFYEGRETPFLSLKYVSSCNVRPLLNSFQFYNKVVLYYSPNSPAISLESAILNIKKFGASGLIYVQNQMNKHNNVLLNLCDKIPCVLINYTVAESILAYKSQESKPSLKLSSYQRNVGRNTPKVASYSSRGPFPGFHQILKPDIAAPGSSILGAHKVEVSLYKYFFFWKKLSLDESSYKYLSGTSMACPHVSGILALLKKLHPNWSQAALKSAIITTASSVGNYGDSIENEDLQKKIAGPFDYGGGQIQPNKAADPGLIFEIHPNDYEYYYSNQRTEPMYLLNLPSISIPELNSSVSITRYVTNVGNVDATYVAEVLPPPGVLVRVVPSKLVFNYSEKVMSFRVKFSPKNSVDGDYHFGSIIWRDRGNHLVKMQIVTRVVMKSFNTDAP